MHVLLQRQCKKELTAHSLISKDIDTYLYALLMIETSLHHVFHEYVRHIRLYPK